MNAVAYNVTWWRSKQLAGRADELLTVQLSDNRDRLHATRDCIFSALVR